MYIVNFNESKKIVAASKTNTVFPVKFPNKTNRSRFSGPAAVSTSFNDLRLHSPYQSAIEIGGYLVPIGI